MNAEEAEKLIDKMQKLWDTPSFDRSFAESDKMAVALVVKSHKEYAKQCLSDAEQKTPEHLEKIYQEYLNTDSPLEAEVLKRGGALIGKTDVLILMHKVHYDAEMNQDDKVLSDALNKIIEMNRQTALDKYGDANVAENWSCVRVARVAMRIHNPNYKQSKQ